MGCPICCRVTEKTHGTKTISEGGLWQPRGQKAEAHGRSPPRGSLDCERFRGGEDRRGQTHFDGETRIPYGDQTDRREDRGPPPQECRRHCGKVGSSAEQGTDQCAPGGVALPP